jgi:hypothetical protein
MSQSGPPDRSAPALGGLADAQKLQTEGSRAVARDPAENEARLLSGEAWSDFCRTLEAAGRTILDAPGREDPWVQAEGFHYLLGLTKVGISQAAELTPEQPRFIRIVDSFSGGGAENADNSYAHAHIRGDLAYRIWGTRGTVETFLVEIKEGFMQLGDVRNFAALEAPELEVEPDGTFELFLGGEPREKNWLPLDPDARQVLIRQYFCDWDSELPATFDIECLGRKGLPPEKLSPARAAEMLDDAAYNISQTASFWQEWVDDLRERYDPASVQPAEFYVGGADDIAYGNDYYTLPEGEAMILEFEPPKAKYWSFQLIDLWFKTPDWPNQQMSINHRQAHLDADGLCRVVVSHSDPGIANWLDTAGEKEGVLQYRWIWTQNNPQPTLRRVPIGELLAALPEGTPRVTSEERRQQIYQRQLHRLRRERI